MFKIENVAVVTGPPDQVSRFLLLITEVDWNYPLCWDQPFPPNTDIDGYRLEPGQTEMSMEIATTGYPATHSLVAASRKCPAVSLHTKFKVIGGPTQVYGSADIGGGHVWAWEYYHGVKGSSYSDSDDCPVRWWEVTFEAMDAWEVALNESSDA